MGQQEERTKPEVRMTLYLDLCCIVKSISNLMMVFGSGGRSPFNGTFKDGFNAVLDIVHVNFDEKNPLTLTACLEVTDWSCRT